MTTCATRWSAPAQGRRRCGSPWALPARRLLGRPGGDGGGLCREPGGIEATIPERGIRELVELAESNELRTPDAEAAHAMREAVKAIRKAQDTLGGIVEVVVEGVPPGLGSYVHWDRRLEAKLAHAAMSIQAMKGIEIGPAFRNATLRGTEVHDELFLGEGGRIERRSNRAGGFEGGVTTGEPIVVRAAMKPISTILAGRRSVDLATHQEEMTVYERSDFTAVPRAVVVVEAMVAFVLADALLEKLGGDSLAELLPRLALLQAQQEAWLREGVRAEPYSVADSLAPYPLGPDARTSSLTCSAKVRKFSRNIAASRRACTS